METLTTATIENITRAVQTELLKRGFTARLSVERKETRSGQPYLEITSEPFNTVPVIMESIAISGTLYITQSVENAKMTEIGGQVGVQYSHFSGGTNGTELFSWSCAVFEGNDSIFKMAIR